MRCVRGSIRAASIVSALALVAGLMPMVMAHNTGVPESPELEIPEPEIPELEIPEPESADSPVVVEAPAGETAARIIVIPKLTEIEIEILEPLGSKLSTSLDRFALRLAEPIIIDGVEVVPAGTPGVGEVVHAKKAGGMGAAGELVLAARYLELGDRRVRLRSMELQSEEAKSRIGTANALGTAGAATALPVALIGFLIRGGQIDVLEGTIATARTAENFSVTVIVEPAASNDMADAEVSADSEIPADELAVSSGEN